MPDGATLNSPKNESTAFFYRPEVLLKFINSGFSMKIQRILLIVLFATLVAIVASLLTLSDPSTDDLDRDIASIRAEITSATNESGKYSGGLLKGLIDTRAEMLRLTEAMLDAKRKSILRRVNLRFEIEGHSLVPAAASDLAKIKNDMSEARSRVTAAEARAGQYTGGLVQALALTTAETERLALAQLQLAYYSAKYGLSAPKLKALESGEVPSTSTPGTVVKDRDAL